MRHLTGACIPYMSGGVYMHIDRQPYSMETRFDDSGDVKANSPMSALVPAIEEAFAAYEQGNVVMPAKSYIDLPQYNGDFRSMPAYIDAGKWDAAGIKWVNVHPENEDQFGLPTVMGTMVYSDPENGFPLAIMDGTELTMRRTGAAAAVATGHLAMPDSSSIGLVGAGVQAHTQLEAISEVRSIEDVLIFDVDEDAAAEFAESYKDEYNIRKASLTDVAACDIVSTTTPVRDPILTPDMVGKNTHINAMGADAEGKHELADDLLKEGKLVIDDYEQTTHSGEINVPWNAGVLDDEDIHAQIGEIVVGAESGRMADDGVSVFDSTGLAIQDVAAAHVVYEHGDDSPERSKSIIAEPSS